MGSVFARVGSLLLLPVYTYYLRPAQYAQIAILDLTTVFCGTIIGAGMVAATTRYNCSSDSERDRDRVWWTGWGTMLLTATIVTVPLWLLRGRFTHLTLGSDAAGRHDFFRTGVTNHLAYRGRQCRIGLYQSAQVVEIPAIGDERYGVFSDDSDPIEAYTDSLS